MAIRSVILALFVGVTPPHLQTQAFRLPLHTTRVHTLTSCSCAPQASRRHQQGDVMLVRELSMEEEVPESISRRSWLKRLGSLATVAALTSSTTGLREGRVGTWGGTINNFDFSPLPANAFGFGGPSRPLNRCLVNVVNARETSRMLEIDLGRGDRIQECRGLVKAVLRGLELKECVKDASLYLPEGRKRQAALDAGRDGIEYLASAVEFDAWDKLDKEFTSNVALRNMTPDNVTLKYYPGSSLVMSSPDPNSSLPMPQLLALHIVQECQPLPETVKTPPNPTVRYIVLLGHGYRRGDHPLTGSTMVQFVRMALDAAGTCLDSFLGVFPPVAVEDAGEVYRRYYMPVTE